MKILIIVSNFVPEIGSAAHIYYDLSAAFLNNGHEVDIITSYPRDFYLNKNDRGKQFPLEENINGINVHRHKACILSRDNLVLRGLEHYLLPISYLIAYKKLHKKFDVCLIYIPPIPLYYLGRVIKWLDKTPYVLNIQDFHPQELVDVGMLKNKLLIWIMERIERSSYRHADYITVMSEIGKYLIISRGGKAEKVTSIYNSVNITNFDSGAVRKDFKEKEQITDKILVTYAGILSPFQGLDDVLETAKMMKDHKDVIFYIVGDGMEKSRLEKRVTDEKIANVKIIPLQPRDEYLNIINSSDIALVTLDKRMTAPVLPGKFINILSVKTPVIANVPNGNVAQIVAESKCGIVTEPGKPGQIVDAILLLKDDSGLRQEYGINGRKFVEKNMNLDINYNIYINIFNKITSEEL